MDREAAVRAIADAAKQGRPTTPRRTWIAAIALAVVCVGALAIAWIEERDQPASSHREPRTQERGGSGGFDLGVGVGLGAGVALTLAVIRLRRS